MAEGDPRGKSSTGTSDAPVPAPAPATGADGSDRAGTASAGSGESRPWHRHPLLRRLPLLVVGLVGIWLWRSAGNERQLIWQLGPGHSTIREIEFQLRDAEGALVDREALFFESGAPAEITLDVSLPEGTYAADVFLERAGAQTPEVHRVQVELEGEVSVERVGPR